MRINEKLNNYRILGFGGAARNVIKALIAQKFDTEKLFYFDCDKDDLDGLVLKNKFPLGVLTTFGKSTNGKMESGKSIYKEHKDLFTRLTKSDCLYILVGGFGGGFNTGVMVELSALLQSAGKKFVVIGNLPYNDEGNIADSNATAAVSEIGNRTYHVLLVKNDLVRRKYPDDSKPELLKKIDLFVVGLIREIIDHTDSETVINSKALIYEGVLEDLILNVKRYILDFIFSFNQDDNKIIIPDTNKELLELLKVDYEYVHQIHPRRFEELVEYIYKLSGLETKLTKSSHDDGADVLVWSPPPVWGDSFLTVVQAKRYGIDKPIGSSDVRDLGGSKLLFTADRAHLVSTSDFSGPAVRTAKSLKIDLLKFYELNETIKSYIE
jgi:HJR/Mrr/RecB family endonuclease